MTKKEQDKQRVLNGGRGSGQAYRRLFEYYENKVFNLKKENEDLEKENVELNDKLNNLAKVAEVRLANWQKYAKENAKLEEFINAPHTKGRKTTRADYIKTVWDLSKKLTEAKELIEDIYYRIPSSHSDYYKDVMERARQFLKED